MLDESVLPTVHRGGKGQTAYSNETFQPLWPRMQVSIYFRAVQLTLSGQNLAREWGKWIENKDAGPEDSVRRWFIEKNYYTFGKFAYPMQSWMCRKEPCGHYTQVSNIRSL